MRVTPSPLAPVLPTTSAPAELQKAAQDFETAFLTPMLEEALRTAGEASFGAGQAETVWRSFMARAMAEEMTQSGKTGIAQDLVKHMIASQKAAQDI